MTAENAVLASSDMLQCVEKSQKGTRGNKSLDR